MLEATRRVLAERRPHAGIELLFTPKEEVGLLGAAAFDSDRLRRPRRAMSTTRPRRSAKSSSARRTRTSMRGPLPRACVPLGHVSRGGPLRDRRRREGNRRLPPRPCRRGLDRECRCHRRRHREEHRPRVVHVPRRGAFARPAEARRPRPGDARGGHVRGRAGGLRGRHGDEEDVPRLPLQAGRPTRCGSPRTP